MNFKDELKIKQEMVNNYLDKIMDIQDVPNGITEAMKYSIFAGGKRIRPVLAMSICQAIGGDEREILPYACAIELIHTYSLIHDDLPAMDNDDLRRGKPTNHIVFGEAKAILAGDGLLNYAYEIMLKAVRDSGCERKGIEALSLIAEAAGVKGMIGGQVTDMESENCTLTLEQLIKMHKGKTGALIEASCIAGCIIADKEDKTAEVAEYSRLLGIAFQIVDDILDNIGDTVKLGKTTGQDAANNKSTFVSILGLEKSKELAEEYSFKALHIARGLDSSGFLAELTEYLLHREN